MSDSKNRQWRFYFIVVLSETFIPLCVLAYQALIGKNMLKETEKAKNEALDKSNNIENILNHIKQSISRTTDFDNNLKDDVKFAQTISNELTTVFNEVSKSIESQANSVNDIASSMNNE